MLSEFSKLVCEQHGSQSRSIAAVCMSLIKLENERQNFSKVRKRRFF